MSCATTFPAKAQQLGPVSVQHYVTQDLASYPNQAPMQTGLFS
jgi:hypothetical protein